MSDASDADDLDEVRERKLEELRERVEGGSDGTDGATGTSESSGSTAPNEPIHLGASEDFQSIIGTHDVVLVDFYADWCGPCKMLEPVVEDLAESTPAAVLKVDVDDHQMLASQHGVRGVPTLLLVADGEVREQLVGVQDEARLRSLIEQYAS